MEGDEYNWGPGGDEDPAKSSRGRGGNTECWEKTSRDTAHKSEAVLPKTPETSQESRENKGRRDRRQMSG